jgi:hypothetical protein
MSEPIKNRRLTLRELLDEVMDDDGFEPETRYRAMQVADKLDNPKPKREGK